MERDIRIEKYVAVPANRIRTLQCLLIFMALCRMAQAQPAARLTEPIDGRRTVALRGGWHPRAFKLTDEGPVDDATPIKGISFRFKPSDTQSAALEQLLEDQQNPSSPLYHVWLTPDEYADRFGLAPADLARVRDWIETQGFHIDAVARSRTSITFSGTAAQVRNTFKTAIHRYRGMGRTHFANSDDAEVPVDLNPLVHALRGLDDFRIGSDPRPHPHVNYTNGVHAIGPGDLAKIYNISALYAKGLNGSGQKIVVAGQTGFKMSDVQDFRSLFHMPKNDPQMILVPGSPDPGINDDVDEALLDVQYAGAAAPNATILYVYSDNVFGAAEYAIDENLAPVISTSYGGCERNILNAPNVVDAFRSVAKQAIAQGITWVVSSGDTGPAACERQDLDTAGIHGIFVNFPASLPELTAVGGTEFNEGTGNYWGPNGPDNSSAQSYIPEIAWNDTKADGKLAASGGGSSALFARPAWQTGPGVPNLNARLVPDISFTASWDHDAYVVIRDADTMGYGGTSAGTPFFAGVLALLNQQVVKSGVQPKPGLGNINPRLYQLAQTTSRVFHDITLGDNIIPCQAASPDCKTGSYGFRAGPGYDLVTGLGSLDVSNLLDSWAGASTPGTISTSVSITANPGTVSADGTTVLTATVKASGGSASPSGSVAFNSGKIALGTANLSNSQGAATATISIKGSQLAIGSNTITASYGGSATFSPSSGSANVVVTASKAAPAVTLSVVPTPVYEQEPDEDGFAWYYTVRLTENSGKSSKLTAFTLDGDDYTEDIRDWFGSTTLDARGTLSVALRSKDLVVPAKRIFSFSGVDSAGQRWTQDLQVPFLPAKNAAVMTLSSSPSTVVQNPKGDPHCSADHPFYQQLNLEEQNGYDVKLTKFLAGSSDLSDQLAKWFGSQALDAYGTLRTSICWQIDAVPTTFQYEVSGIDTGGHTITTTLEVTFKGPAQNPGTLSLSRPSILLLPDSSGSATTSLTVNVPAGEEWSVSTVPSNPKTGWLVVSPQSGKGSAEVKLNASATDLAAGVHEATLVFQSVNTLPAFINVPVTFITGAPKSATRSTGRALRRDALGR